MHNNQDLSLARANRVLTERLRPAIHSHPQPLALAAHRVGGEPIPVADGLAAEYVPAQVGDPWGRAWDTTWFRVTGTVPAAFAGRRVEVLLDLGFDTNMTGFQAEGLVYRADGSPVRSLHPRAQWIPVAKEAAGGEPIEFYVEAASNPVLLDYVPFLPTEKGEWETAGEELLYRVRRADAVIFETEVFELVHDVEVLLQLAEQLDAGSARRAKILFALDRALDAVDLQDVAGTAAAGRAQLAEVLAAPAAPSSHLITAVGHAHIDSAWLWPLRETVRKVARTTSSMVTLLEEHDDFVYAMSSAQQYAWIKQHRPEVYARVKQAVADGRFVPVGGMWVEADAVLPGGEAMIRQFLYGQRFFRDEFGIECRGAWLPDSFGYSAALPQLLVGAGFEWFLTQKISWNERNVFPHSSFEWEGIDGSRIFTHFPPMDTYNSQLSGAEVALADRNFKEKSVGSSSLAPTGWGDGGGGTTREMIARAKRLADLEGSAKVVWEHPDVFFARARAELPEPAVWKGELYLERHRATYTTQHKMKQGNRRNEQLLFEAELWASVAAVRAGRAYPYELLDGTWQEVLLLQFHDILPGTSIAWVHREAAARHARVTEILQGVIADSLAALGVELVEPVETTAPLVEPAETTAPGLDKLDQRDLLVNAAPIAQSGVGAGSVGVATAGSPISATASGDGFVLASDSLRVELDAAGHLVSAVDLASGRDAIPAGERGNLLQLHQDFPNLWDAWDVDNSYRKMRRDLDAADEVRLDGDAIVVRRSFGASSIEQRLSLSADGRALLIDNTVDWQETEKFLKLAFPIDVFADTAVAETQFGFQTRTTHDNTSWENARFETHAQRWFLVREPGFGVAFANDSSYGFDVVRSRRGGAVVSDVRFSMLRAPRFPDPRADLGVQRMRFALAFGADEARATELGWAINTPARPAVGAALAPLVRSSDPRVLISAVKLADDRSGDLIVRLYESSGGRATTQLLLDLDVAAVRAADLLERPGEPVEYAADGAVSVELALRPFQVRTLRITPA
ncbi:MAG: glycoside hydrolase family 38 C-terminal domain-containing protein [Micropruina sp.]|uniref:alpha-mannosidase n=1 Tax=Micropruina sp. TaxID=2737536 RepID=UPI0039E566B9